MLFAWEQVGGADAALNQAKEYALGRYAFGRPIASYQAIKHKLADRVHQEHAGALERLLRRVGAERRRRELPLAAATARVAATQAYYFASKENIQTHGGMGFTWEFDCHLYYRRAKLLSVNIGSESRVAGPPDHCGRTQQRRLTHHARENIMDFNDTPEEARSATKRAPG